MTIFTERKITTDINYEIIIDGFKSLTSDGEVF